MLIVIAISGCAFLKKAGDNPEIVASAITTAVLAADLALKKDDISGAAMIIIGELVAAMRNAEVYTPVAVLMDVIEPRLEKKLDDTQKKAVKVVRNILQAHLKSYKIEDMDNYKLFNEKSVEILEMVQKNMNVDVQRYLEVTDG
jgi:hypothetical protein